MPWFKVSLAWPPHHWKKQTKYSLCAAKLVWCFDWLVCPYNLLTVVSPKYNILCLLSTHSWKPRNILMNYRIIEGLSACCCCYLWRPAAESMQVPQKQILGSEFTGDGKQFEAIPSYVVHMTGTVLAVVNPFEEKCISVSSVARACHTINQAFEVQVSRVEAVVSWPMFFTQADHMFGNMSCHVWNLEACFIDLDRQLLWYLIMFRL